MDEPLFTLIVVMFVVLLSSLVVLSSHSSSAAAIGLAISPSAPSVHQPAHHQFVLTCKGVGAEPNLFSNVRWFDPRGQHVDHNYPNADIRVEQLELGVLLLHFLNPLADTSGRYRCSATFQHSDTFEAHILVNFFQDVTWLDCPPVQSLVLRSRDQNRIRCRAQANPKPSLTWTKEGRELASDRRFQVDASGVTVGDAVQDSDGGVFRVRAIVTETGRIHDTFITVQILEPPSIDALSANLELTEGLEATIRCSTRGLPPPLVTWLDPNKRNLSEVGGYAVDRNSGALVIARVRHPDDGGAFTCLAENAAGQERRSTRVQVLRAPRVTSFENRSVDANSDALMECRATGDPTPELWIRRDGDSRPLAAGDPRVTLAVEQRDLESVLSLRLSPTRRQDDGLYFCRARNRASTVESAGHLEIRFAPDLSRTPTTAVKNWNLQPINVTCVADAIPNATIRWWFRGQDLDQTDGRLFTIERNSAGVSRLHVDPKAAQGSAQRDLYGLYRCEAFNSLGASDVTIRVEEAFRPGALLHTAHQTVTPTTVTFRLLAPSFDGGMPVKTMHVQFRVEDADWSSGQSRQWPLDAKTELYFLDALTPNTRYLFRFAAENDVGMGDFSVERLVRTARESRPERPRFANVPRDGARDVVAPFGRHFGVTWTLPPDNGRRIKYFELKYYSVAPADDGWRATSDVTTTTVSMTDASLTSHTLSHLRPNTYYRVELRAHNDLGFSDAEELVFRTADDTRDDAIDDTTTTAPVALIAGLSLGAVLVVALLVDALCCVRHGVGAIHFLSRHAFPKAKAAPPRSMPSNSAHSVDNPAFEGRARVEDEPFIGVQSAV